jgi:mRNA-degrading endonuclease RelE of RelBE toxin-antitoxin system
VTAPRPYKIVVHRLVTTEDGRRFDAPTREKIKKKIKELLSFSPDQAGEPLRFELAGYRKLKVFDDYRIVYRVDRGRVIVFILSVGLRRDSAVYAEAVRRLGGK